MKEFLSRLQYDPDTGLIHWIVNSKKDLVGSVAGTVEADGYRRISLNQRKYRAHRLAWFMYYGKWPDGEVDHINRDRQDNRIVNLRDVSRSQNGKNLAMTERNTSGVVGVRWDQKKQRWIAKITSGGIYHHLGAFHLKEDAIKARSDAEVKLGFHKNHGKVLTIAN